MKINIENKKQTQKYLTINIIDQNYVDNQWKYFKNNQKSHYFQNEFQWKIYLISFIQILVIFHFFYKASQFMANIIFQESIEEIYYLRIEELDFFGASLFAFFQGIVLVITKIATFDNLRVNLIIINIGGTLTALIIFKRNPEFILISYWIEYLAQLFITLTNFLFSFQSLKKPQVQRERYQGNLMIRMAVKVAIFKLLLFGQIIPNNNPTRLANYLEQIGEMFNDYFVIYLIFIQQHQEIQDSEKIIQVSS